VIKKNLITVISIIGMLAFLNPANANEKSGLRLYHVKISKFDLKAKCMENFPTEELIQQSSSIIKRLTTMVINLFCNILQWETAS